MHLTADYRDWEAEANYYIFASCKAINTDSQKYWFDSDYLPPRYKVWSVDIDGEF